MEDWRRNGRSGEAAQHAGRERHDEMKVWRIEISISSRRSPSVGALRIAWWMARAPTLARYRLRRRCISVFIPTLNKITAALFQRFTGELDHQTIVGLCG